MESQSYDIRFEVPIDLPHLFIDVHHLPMRRDPGSQIRHGDLLEVENSRPSNLSDPGGGNCDQYKLRHRLGSLYLEFFLKAGAEE